ncbi:hypothetical protein ZWY2020_025355 [Hordeum vulgare]|nr:hypothetical protein ZWY2020_025355 [Hordeum vulgare]
MGRVGVGFQDWVPTEVVQFEEDEILVLRFDRAMPLGERVFTMDFTGTLNDLMRGSTGGQVQDNIGGSS